MNILEYGIIALVFAVALLFGCYDLCKDADQNFEDMIDT